MPCEVLSIEAGIACSAATIPPDGLDAALMVQASVYRKEGKRASVGWSFPKSTILVIQLIGSDGDEMMDFLEDELMDEMAETGFREIWISDHSFRRPCG